MFTGSEIIEKPIKYKQGECHACHTKFNSIIKPTLDRIDNSKSHLIDNVIPCCRTCNTKMSNRDKSLEILKIQIHKYALLNNLPFTIDNEKVFIS
jgi:5-methylcytosine-specific restriction endonuclease McrA